MINFQFGFILMVYNGITYIANASRNGRPIHCPSSMQYHAKPVLWYVPGKKGYKNIKLHGSEWEINNIGINNFITNRVVLITEHGTDSIKRYYDTKKDYKVLVLDDISTESSIEDIHSRAIFIGNGKCTLLDHI